MKFTGGSLIMWGCFCGSELAVLWRIESITQANYYVTILENLCTIYLSSLDIFGLENR